MAKPVNYSRKCRTKTNKFIMKQNLTLHQSLSQIHKILSRQFQF